MSCEMLLRCLSLSLIKAGNKPPATSTPGKPKKATTFQEFESITSDAWDVGDDDDELLAMAAQNLNIEVVMETANKVIENHSKQQERRQQQLDEPPGPEEKDEEEGHDKDEEEKQEEDETTPELAFSSERVHYTDSRLVKSHSEAPIGSPKGLYISSPFSADISGWITSSSFTYLYSSAFIHLQSCLEVFSEKYYQDILYCVIFQIKFTHC